MNNIAQPITNAIRNLGNMQILKSIAPNKICDKLKVYRFKIQTTHNQTVISYFRKQQTNRF